MPEQTSPIDLNALRVAQPCPMSWDAMDGDERARMCGRCERQVYNVAAMSGDEVRALLGEERACVRLVRRADGTVMTADCPVGLRAARARVAALAAAALGVLLSAASLALGRGGTSGGVSGADGWWASLMPQYEQVVWQQTVTVGDIAFDPDPVGLEPAGLDPEEEDLEGEGSD